MNKFYKFVDGIRTECTPDEAFKIIQQQLDERQIRSDAEASTFVEVVSFLLAEMKKWQWYYEDLFDRCTETFPGRSEVNPFDPEDKG